MEREDFYWLARFFVTLFLIVFTDSIPAIVFPKIVSVIASPLLSVLIIVYGFRNVSENLDRKVATFGAIKASGDLTGENAKLKEFWSVVSILRKVAVQTVKLRLRRANKLRC